MASKYTVLIVTSGYRGTQRNWNIHESVSGRLVEGGFFDRDAAYTACAEWNAGTR